MNKKDTIGFVTEKSKFLLYKLKNGKFEDKVLYGKLIKARRDLLENPEIGIKIQKRLWPKEYVQKYNITNLWKYDLPKGGRLLYTIEESEIKIVIIIEWFDHKEYERRFKY